jgi:DNA-binding CsgD family transcriptional regulator
LNFDDKIDFYSNQLSDENVAFFKKLQEKSNHTLTALDLKYCIYFMTGLETKEIASKLNIEPKSVRMTRYRIKKKLQLSESDDLYEYLKLTAC